MKKYRILSKSNGWQEVYCVQKRVILFWINLKGSPFYEYKSATELFDKLINNKQCK